MDGTYYLETHVYREIMGDQYVSEEIYNYWDSPNLKLRFESMANVLNYIYDMGVLEGKRQAKLNQLKNKSTSK